MKWRNSKERELLANGGSRDQTLPNKNNPNPDLSDAKCDRLSVSPSPPPTISDVNTPSAMCSNLQGTNCMKSSRGSSPSSISKSTFEMPSDFINSNINTPKELQRHMLENFESIQAHHDLDDQRLYFDDYDESHSDSDGEISVT